MSCVPSSVADAASKRTPSRSFLAELASEPAWLAAVDAFRIRHPRRRDRIADYEALLSEGEHLRVGAAVLAGRYRPAPPHEAWLNKADGRKKRIFCYSPIDELLFRVVNRELQPRAEAVASPWCRSFLPGGGARSAFRHLLADPEIDSKAALRFDVRDYFNSIDPVDLLRRLPDEYADGPVCALLTAALLDPRVERDGTEIDGGRKGVMAGTPIAPILATLYLRDFDREIAETGATYTRYSDDILILAPEHDVPSLEQLVRHRLAERGLEVNEGKSAVMRPGEPWDFLGFRYRHGVIGLAPITEHKLKQRTSRLARGLVRWRERSGASPERAAGAFLRRVNLRLYRVPDDRAHFSWATWFLPMLDHPAPLQPLDAHIQREARYAATGRRTERARRTMPYSALVEAGHVPLLTAFWAMRAGAETYDALVERRAARSGQVRGDRASQGGSSRVVEARDLEHDGAVVVGDEHERTTIVEVSR
jgi:hypothetical protein